MLQVKTYVGKSKISGDGCKAAQPIKKDQITWVYDPSEIFDKKIDYLEKYGWYDSVMEAYVYPMDNARWINHSDDANTYVDGSVMRAKRDIDTNEEITENYKDYMNENDVQRHLGADKKKEKTM